MSTFFILDSNVFLELPYKDGHFCVECDNIFGMQNIKNTTKLIMNREINPIHNERLLILRDIQKFYEKNKGSLKYPAKRTYFQTTFEFKDTILNKIVAKDSKQIVKSVKSAIVYISKMMQHRINSLTNSLIKTTKNKQLRDELVNIMHDEDDAQHIIDSTVWAFSNGNSDFISLNTHHLSKYGDQIKLCVSNHYGWANCNVNFKHPADY